MNHQLPPGANLKNTKPPGKTTRRDFLWLSFGWAASLFAMGATCFAMVRSMVPNVLFEPSRRFKAGRPEDYSDQSPTFIEEVRLYILRKDNSYRAVSAICPHLGCTVSLVNAEYPFLCPCHGSYFNNLGEVMSGPSPSGLNWLSVSLSKDGRLVIDLDQVVDVHTHLTV